jgi:hypothetical protein
MIALFVHIVFGITLLVSMHSKQLKQQDTQKNETQTVQVRK